MQVGVWHLMATPDFHLAMVACAVRLRAQLNSGIGVNHSKLLREAIESMHQCAAECEWIEAIVKLAVCRSGPRTGLMCGWCAV